MGTFAAPGSGAGSPITWATAMGAQQPQRRASASSLSPSRSMAPQPRSLSSGPIPWPSKPSVDHYLSPPTPVAPLVRLGGAPPRILSPRVESGAAAEYEVRERGGLELSPAPWSPAAGLRLAATPTWPFANLDLSIGTIGETDENPQEPALWPEEISPTFAAKSGSMAVPGGRVVRSPTSAERLEALSIPGSFSKRRGDSFRASMGRDVGKQLFPASGVHRMSSAMAPRSEKLLPQKTAVLRQASAPPKLHSHF